LDGVRRLTNFSTGALGTGLANHLAGQGHQVALLRGYYAVTTATVRTDTLVTFTTTADLGARLQALSAQPWHAIFHAAAVSDFSFGRVYRPLPTGELAEVKSGKYSTRDGTLLAELIPTPKIIGSLRDWFPNARLVGWKYEVDGSRADAIAAGAEQLRCCRTDACVVNGPAYGQGFGLVSRALDVAHLGDATELYQALGDLLL
jgi:phosphopantothenoylcysteine synthetase/decarboxylase